MMILDSGLLFGPPCIIKESFAEAHSEELDVLSLKGKTF